MTVTTFLLLFALAGGTSVQTMGPFPDEASCILNKERIIKTFRKSTAECFVLTNSVQQPQPQPNGGQK